MFGSIYSGSAAILQVENLGQLMRFTQLKQTCFELGEAGECLRLKVWRVVEGELDRWFFCLGYSAALDAYLGRETDCNVKVVTWRQWWCGVKQLFWRVHEVLLSQNRLSRRWTIAKRLFFSRSNLQRANALPFHYHFSYSNLIQVYHESSKSFVN